MNNRGSRFFSHFIFIFSISVSAAHAESPPPAKVPAWATFQRTLEIEGFLQPQNRDRAVNQSLRARLRYLDPAVNAYVAVVGNAHHFNEDLFLDEPPNRDRVVWLGNLGLGVGLERGRHRMGLDLMAVYAGTTLGPAAAILGEHQLGRGFGVYHTTQLNLFTGETQDGLLDADAGLQWTRGTLTLRAGYRVLSSQHANRSGPRLGIVWRFSSPKIPFVFPSLG